MHFRLTITVLKGMVAVAELASSLRALVKSLVQELNGRVTKGGAVGVDDHFAVA